MQDVAAGSGRLREFFDRTDYVDSNLPVWARRTHPLVKRHLGAFWRVMPLQVDSLLRWYGFQVVLIAASVLLEFLFVPIVAIGLLSLPTIPVLMVMYARTLYDLVSDSSRSMVRDVENNTLQLLRVGPFSTLEILGTKIAGSMWRQSDPLTVLLTGVTLLSLPIVVVYHLNRFPPDTAPIASQLGMALMLGVSMLRIPLELVMCASVGQYLGTVTPGRSAATGSALFFVLGYFAVINMLRLMPGGWIVYGVVELLLPVLLPVLITYLTITMTKRAIEAD